VKKVNFHFLAMMLSALLFADVVPAAENNASKKIESKKIERLWCWFVCEGDIDPIGPKPKPDSAKPKPASKTTTEKR
jgi:hypothetical protein